MAREHDIDLFALLHREQCSTLLWNHGAGVVLKWILQVTVWFVASYALPQIDYFNASIGDSHITKNPECDVM